MVREVPFFRTSIDESDIERVAAVLRTNFLTTGPVVAELEQSLASYTDTAAAVVVTSGTAALHLSLIALGIGSGDEIITTPMSFVATSNAIVQAGARPVFVDVDSGTGNIDADRVEAAITPRTRAVLPVHMYGQPCDMRALSEISSRHDLAIVEDAAHALEARQAGEAIGARSAAACLSFYATKNITSGEGGAIVTRDRDLAERLRRLRLHGLSAGAADRYTGLYRHYDVPEPGWKCNMSDIQAALLVGQLARVDDLLAQRVSAFNRYADAFQDVDGIRMPIRIAGDRHAAHLFTIQVDPRKRDTILHGLQQRAIGVAVNFRAIHLFEGYTRLLGHALGDFPEAERIGSSTVTLPLYPNISVEDQQIVINAVKETVHEAM